MNRLINSKTTTIKFPTPNGMMKSTLKHDALYAVLVSINPLHSNYNFTDEDYKIITKHKEIIETELRNLERHLYSKIKRI